MKGWRTIAFNVVSAILPIMELTELRDVIPEQWVLYYVLAVAVGNIYLRTVTTTPIGRPE